MRFRMLAIALVCASVYGQAQDPRQAEKERGLGARVAAQIRQRTTPLGVEAVDEYVSKIGLRLAAQMPNAAEDWKFTVIRRWEIGPADEPLGVPGGWIFVPAQLILSADSEAEFAGMLAHAMAHVAERQVIRPIPGKLPVMLIGRSVPAFELDADRVAVKAMAAAAFDPNALLDYVTRVESKDLTRIDNLKQAVGATLVR